MPTPQVNAAYTPIGQDTGIPARLSRPLKASAIVGLGQFATVSLATGYAELNDGTVPNQAAAGVGDPSVKSDSASIDGAAVVRLSQRWLQGLPASSVANDGFTEADFGKPFYIADENTPGKKSNNAGSNRSMGGLVFGLGADGNPILWTGPVAWLLARAAHQLDATVGGSCQIADAAASTATTERAIRREPVHGVVTAVEFTGAAVAADNTNNAVVTISKRDGAGGAAVVVATLSTDPDDDGAITAFVPKAFTLNPGDVSGALNLLETDILTVTVTKGGTGQVLTGNIRVIQKVV